MRYDVAARLDERERELYNRRDNFVYIWLPALILLSKHFIILMKVNICTKRIGVTVERG